MSVVVALSGRKVFKITIYKIQNICRYYTVARFFVFTFTPTPFMEVKNPNVDETKVSYNLNVPIDC